MENAVITAEEKRWRRRHALAVLAILCFYMLCPVAPERWGYLYESYGKFVIVAVAAIYFMRRGIRGSAEVKLVVWYAIWLFVTRLLNTDYYLTNELDLVLSRVLCCVVLPTGMLLDGGERARLLDLMAAVLGLFYLAAALLSIYACFFGTYFYIPPEGVVFGIDYPDYFNHLVILNTNRTLSAIWLYIAWCLMTYEFFNCRGRLWRIPIVLAWLVFLVAIALAYSRTVKLAVGVNLAMLLLLWGMRSLRIRSRALKGLALAAMLLLTVPAVYKGFDLVTGGMSSLIVLVGADEDRPSDEFINYREAEHGLSDPRTISDSASAESARSQIYRSFLPTLRQDPLRILIGKYSDKLMDIPHTMMIYPFTHMHNYLLQTFMLTGAPGFLLVLAFSVLMVWRCVRLFFSKAAAATTAVKSLVLPVTGLFMYSMLDVLMFTGSPDLRSMTTDVRELFFFLICGVVLAYSYELYPDRPGKRNGG